MESQTPKRIALSFLDATDKRIEERMKKKYRFKKGDFVTAAHLVKTEYEADVFEDYQTIIHTPADNWKIKKVLVSMIADKTPYLVVGVKKIQTGYYSPMVAPSSNWTGSDEGDPATFAPDKFHDVYVLEQANTQVWRTVVFALESDLEVIAETKVTP